LENKRIIDLGPEQKQIFMEKLKRDVNFLVYQHKMDYSLLIGIHDLDQGGIERERRMSGIDMNTSNLSGNESSDGSESPTPIGDDGSFDEPFRMRSSESSTRRELYNLGIMDILTNYGMKKKECICSKNKIIWF